LLVGECYLDIAQQRLPLFVVQWLSFPNLHMRELSTRLVLRPEYLCDRAYGVYGAAEGYGYTGLLKIVPGQ
jgi:hypothetical protein